MGSCVGTILSVLKEPVITHWNYVTKYKDLVKRLEQENRRLREKKERIQRLVDTATRNGRFIEPEVSNWLGDVEQMERVSANFLRRQENGEQMERDFANFLRQQENGEQMELDFANFLRQQENGEQMERDIANFLRQQENGEQMKRNFANFLRQQGESFKCFPGCMCPNLMWRYKMGVEAGLWKLHVIDLLDRARQLPESLELNTPFQWEPHFDSSQYYTTFPSRASVFDKIMEALKDSVVDMIGVHGPGGAGKTTMVKEVAKDAKKLGIFDKIVIAVVSKDPDTSKLQEELATHLDLKYERTSESGRADELRKALLNRKKILIVLDDLWQGLDLKVIGIPISGPGHERCKILLTSRSQEVFKGMGVRSTFSIGYLEEKEASELFKKVTGDFGVKVSIAREVIKRCGGLPIAILAVGAALKDEEEVEWLNALRQLRIRPLKYIEGIGPMGYTPLKWSYNFLKDENAKSFFLLCCLFPEDAEISMDDLVRYGFALRFLRRVHTLKDARIEVQAMVNMLKRSCLLLNGEQENFVKMHDVIRDLAISITEEKQTEHGSGHDWPGQQQFIVDHDIRKWPDNDAWNHHTAISLKINDDNIHFPRGVLECPLMHTLVLKLGKSSLQIPNDFFQGMKGARILDLKDILLELPSLVLELDHLRMLRLNNCQLLGDLSTIRNLKNHIEILSLEGSTIKELPREIRELTLLRSLNLRECESLKVIPEDVISNLISLEELYVTSRFKEWDTTVDGGGMRNASITELNSLIQLIALHVGVSEKCSKRMALECPGLFEKLINFNISISNDRISYDKSSAVLDIDGIHHIEDEFWLLMDKVGKLILSEIQDLGYLPSKPQLQSTPSDGGSFHKLTYLEIYRCDSIKYLFSPSCSRALQQLQVLDVGYCRKMEQIIGDCYPEEKGVTDEAIIFERLTYMVLGELPQFRSFYPEMEKTTIGGNLSNSTTTAEFIFNEKVSFPVLETFLIFGLLVEDIWNKQEIQSPKRSNEVSFSQLTEVKINYCDKLVNAFPSNMLQRLQNLKTLEVEDCPSLILIVEDLSLNIQSPRVQSKFIDVFPKLRSLVLANLPKLMKTWLSDADYYSYDNSVNLCLESIKIKGCGSLTRIFSAFVAKHLACIQDLCITDCSKMEVIVSEAGGKEEARGKEVTDDVTTWFCELKKLQLENLPNLRNFYESKFESTHFFNHQVAFPKMESLYLINLKNSREIQLWDLLGTTQEHLQLVRVIGCPQVSTMVSSHHRKRRFRMLDTLHLENCQGFKYVVDLDGTTDVGEEQYVDVEVLELYDLQELVSLWNKDLCEIGGFQSLKHIDIKECPQLKSLFMHSKTTTLQHLKILEVRSCEMIEEIIIIKENHITIARKEKATCQIEFPKLEVLILFNLPNLKNFCNDERGSFGFSSLCRVKVLNCPKMKTFASGQIRLPSGMIQATVGDEKVEITNLNAFFGARNEDNNHMMKTIYWEDG